VPTLYTADRCPYAARARIVLVEKGIAYEAVEIDLDDRPGLDVREEHDGPRAGLRGGRGARAA
jgi:glutathione S-transferase